MSDVTTMGTKFIVRNEGEWIE